MSVFKSYFICLLLCLTFFCKSQNTLRGTIRSASDSTALSGALVMIPELQLRSYTDAAGNFSFKNLPSGFLKIHVLHAGYTSISTNILFKDSIHEAQFYLQTNISELDEIVIYGHEESKSSETANTIDVLDSKSMRESGALSLCDGIAKLPGVSQLSTGPGISKPVIRGLFGNRVQTLLLGMRFDNQQWQDEHGLGLPDIGIDRIEIIKGPSSLLYGSEAMGGVLTIMNEKAAEAGKLQADVSGRYFSNTYGYGLDAGVKKSNTKSNWIIRLGTESHADYSDGNNMRILNSRFGGNTVKASYGFKYKKWVSENNYLFSLYNFGFIMDAYQLYDTPDDRQARSFERPHHTVSMNLISSQNTIFLRRSKFKFNLGAHFNHRQEQEGSGGISLDMLLKTYSAMFLWIKNFGENTELSLGSQNMFQSNANMGSRIIVPDANLGESSLYAYLKKQFKYAIVEGGLRYDLKNIQTFQTGELNTGNVYKPGSGIVPVNKLYNTFNGSFGFSAFDSKHWNLKANVSSGYRGPNLAELSSNGLHEGSLRYELGNIDLKIEQNLCLDLYASYTNKWITVFANAYENRFLNYIYLQPSNDDYLGFKIYNYVQKDAIIRGYEGGIKLHPSQIKFIELSSTFSKVQGETKDHEYLPFIPANKITNELKFKFPTIRSFKNCFFSATYIYVFEQNTPNQFETKTPAYSLVNAAIGTERKIKKINYILSLSGNNLLNEAYFDHLSRYKYYGIYNIGRSININFKIQFN